jgi:hypothetical protein
MTQALIGPALVCALLLTPLATVQAQGAQGATSSPSWAELTPAERLALQPLQPQWNQIDLLRKQKWREIAAKLPSMPRDQQIRMQARMAEWVAMTPAQRNTARLHYETSRQLPTAERQALWESYQALPEKDRKDLAEQAVSRKAKAVAEAGSAVTPGRFDRTQPKSNVVQAPQRPNDLGVRQSGPASVQASVGASTRPMNQHPTPPRHQQAGMPKIAATPGFVNDTTLLPQRGPQGAVAEATPKP